MQRDRIDFHTHTIFSKDSLSKPVDVIARAKKSGLTKLVITDHNTVRGAVAAKNIDPEFIILGEEIMTTQGEILACYVKEEIPAGLEPMRVIELLKKQGAFISVSHPFDVHRKGHWSHNELESIAPYIDAIEGFNSRCINPMFNQLAQKFAKEHKLQMTVGSDAHSLPEIGRAFLDLDLVNSADELRVAIKNSEMQTTLSSAAIHLTSRWAVLVKKIGKDNF